MPFNFRPQATLAGSEAADGSPTHTLFPLPR